MTAAAHNDPARIMIRIAAAPTPLCREAGRGLPIQVVAFIITIYIISSEPSIFGVGGPPGVGVGTGISVGYGVGVGTPSGPRLRDRSIRSLCFLHNQKHLSPGKSYTHFVLVLVLVLVID